jgi:hypothetical protein
MHGIHGSKIIFKDYVHQVSTPVCSALLPLFMEAVHHPVKNVVTIFLSSSNTCFIHLIFFISFLK